ncbi:MAG: chromosomal replication initiator protein DnaA [Dehalococcoidia bacterium]|nr:chromosomal replication initiator protein DnaA [Dehalococcoidia bacterium]
MKLRSAQEIWETALGQLQVEVNKANFATWFKKTTGIDFRDGRFEIGVPNTFIAEYLEKNQRSLIERVLTGILRDNVRLEFRVADAGARIISDRTPLPLFNPRYTFDSFIVGNSNNLAFAAATKVAENPGQNFNPLYLHGGSGLGKTHLLHAIGNYAITRNFHVLCVSAEQYTNELVTSIREKTTDDFRRKFRTVDILLLDDVQFFGGKEQTEENFFHTFNELHAANHQIVVTSDRVPQALPALKERLRSRLEWGLVADLQPPDFETRLNVLKAKAERERVDVTAEVLEFIALQIKENIRALEGALNRVIAYAKLLRTAITPDMAARAIDDIASKQPRLPPVTLELIVEMVAGAFQVSLSDLRGRRRDDTTATARQAAMYLMREETECSLADIGRQLGGRSPATISYACGKITESLNNDPHLRRQLFNIQQKLHAQRNI